MAAEEERNDFACVGGGGGERERESVNVLAHVCRAGR